MMNASSSPSAVVKTKPIRSADPWNQQSLQTQKYDEVQQDSMTKRRSLSSTDSYSRYDSYHLSPYEENPHQVLSKKEFQELPKVPLSFPEWRHILKENDIVVLYIWKESCVPCHHAADEFCIMNRYYHSVERPLPSSIRLLFITDQIDPHCVEDPQCPSHAHWRLCEAVPYFMIYVQNQLVYRQAGFDRRTIVTTIEEAIEHVIQSPSFQKRQAEQTPPVPEIIQESPNIIYTTYH